jgi:hypothetical protein
LKNQINVLLSDVLGLEHEVDDVHNYDDFDLKTKIDGLNEKLESFKEDVNAYVNGVISRITGSITPLRRSISKTFQTSRSQQ